MSFQTKKYNYAHLSDKVNTTESELLFCKTNCDSFRSKQTIPEDYFTVTKEMLKTIYFRGRND